MGTDRTWKQVTPAVCSEGGGGPQDGGPGSRRAGSTAQNKKAAAFLFPSGASGSGGQGKRPSLLRGHGPQGQYPLQPQVPRGASCAGTACTPTDQSSHRAPASALGPPELVPCDGEEQWHVHFDRTRDIT